MANTSRVAAAFIILLLGLPSILNADEPKPALKVENFDHDPGWETHNSHVVLEKPKTVKQAFGYSATNFAGKEKGEIGGTVWRGGKLASYARAIGPKTLSDRLSASGTFAITATSGTTGIFFGWFNAKTPEGGRQNSLGIHVSGEGSGARLTLQLVTNNNQACGTKVTPWIVDKTKPKGDGRKFRPTSIKNDGTRYNWQIDYDPAANDSNGQMRFVIRSNSEKPDEAFEGKTFTVDLPKGYKEHGSSFDRFGIVNGNRPGNSMTAYFDGITIDGDANDFSTEPKWIGEGNDASYVRTDEGGAHDFGFSEKTNFAGGSAGEVGGTIWRSGDFAYYADRVGPLSLDDRLEASGKVILNVGPADSGMLFGWFNSADKKYSPIQSGSFVGVKVGGPTRVGHYFVPAYATTHAPPVDPGDRQQPSRINIERSTGPVLTPLKQFDWKLVYDPKANDGKGAIEATLGTETVTLPLKPGDRAKGATLDRFGLFSIHQGGSYVKIYFDDLKYTAARP